MLRSPVFILCFALLLISPIAAARVWYVSADGTGDVPTIAAGYQSATYGDTVLVGPGTFFEHDLHASRLVHLISEQGAQVTIIDAGGGTEGIVGLWTDAPYEVAGFTILNAAGAGIALYSNGTQLIRDCVIRGCGVGVRSEQSNGVIRNLTIVGCTALNGTSGSGFSVSGGQLMVSNCIIALNDGYGIADWSTGTNVFPSCCCFYRNDSGNFYGLPNPIGVDGNFSSDPVFCDYYSHDLHLASDSPCAPGSPYNTECELVGALPVGCSVLSVQPDGGAEYATIQDAIDAAAEGDYILLASGMYTGAGNRDVNFGGKGIHVVAAGDGGDSCVVDCQRLGRGFIFSSGEDESAVLSGITVQRGRGDRGGAILCDGAAPLISSCTLADNEALFEGGGICCRGGSAPRIDHCTLVSNAAPLGSGIAGLDGAAITAENSIIAFGVEGEAVGCDPQSSATLGCSDVFENQGGDWVGCLAGQEGAAGNFSADPRLCGDLNSSHQFSVTGRSPCASGNNDNCGQIGAWPPQCRSAIVVAPDGSGDLPTIQAAIHDAYPGEYIELTDGTYAGPSNRNLHFDGRAITIRSQSGDPYACIIDCENATRGVSYQGAEGVGVELSGLTIVHGAATFGGAVSIIEGASPLIRDCRLVENDATLGGAVYVNASSPVSEQCLLLDNFATQGGAVLCQNGSAATFTGCTFARNGAIEEGGAVTARYQTSAAFNSCTFDSNAAPVGSNVSSQMITESVLSNCVLAFGISGEAIACGTQCSATLSCCDLYANEGGDWVGCIAEQYGTNGNIAADPLFCRAIYPDMPWRLQEDSPCAPFTPSNPECDLIGAWPVGCDAMAVEVELEPEGVLMSSISPNPLRLLASIRYRVPNGSGSQNVSLCILDASGRLIRRLVDDRQPCGTYVVKWSGTDEGGRTLPAGVYYLSLRAGDEQVSRSLVLIR